MTFAEILQELREDKNISRKALATKLNISVSTLGMYEQGRREPNIDMLIKIADYFEVSIDFLVGRKFKDNDMRLLEEAFNLKKKIMRLSPDIQDIVEYILSK